MDLHPSIFLSAYPIQGFREGPGACPSKGERQGTPWSAVHHRQLLIFIFTPKAKLLIT